MLSVYWTSVIFGALSLVFMGLGAIFAALAFATAHYRFGKINGNNQEKLKYIARFCTKNTSKLASTLLFARKITFFCAAFCLFLAIIVVLKNAYGDISVSAVLIVALSSALLTMFVEYALFDLPAVKASVKSPTKMLHIFTVPFVPLYIIFSPIEYLSRKVSKKIYGKKVFKGESPKFDFIDVELMLRAEDSETERINTYTKKIIRNALKLQELDVSDVMIPRNKITFLDTNESFEENLRTVNNARYNRYPLCNADLDSCYGIIHLRDILKITTNAESTDLLKYRHQTLRIKESEKLESALAKMLRYKLRIILVEDEFGGISGMLTLDAALSELVGQIRADFAKDTEENIRAIGKNKYKDLGIAPLRKVEDFLDVDFQTDEVSTFGGLITALLGRFPELNETIRLKKQKMTIVVDKLEGAVISECTVTIEEQSQQRNS